MEVRAQVACQDFGRIDSVAGKGDIAERETLALVDFHLHIDAVLLLGALGGIDGVEHNAGIAIALLVVVGDDAVEVVLKLRIDIFRGFPEILFPEIEFPEIVNIVGVVHLGLQLAGRDGVVALEDEMLYFEAFACAHIEHYLHAVGLAARGVLCQLGFDRHIAIAILDIVTAYAVFGSGEHILGNHVANTDVHLLAQFVGIAFLDAVKLEARHLRAGL